MLPQDWFNSFRKHFYNCIWFLPSPWWMEWIFCLHTRCRVLKNSLERVADCQSLSAPPQWGSWHDNKDHICLCFFLKLLFRLDITAVFRHFDWFCLLSFWNEDMFFRIQLRWKHIDGWNLWGKGRLSKHHFHLILLERFMSRYSLKLCGAF